MQSRASVIIATDRPLVAAGLQFALHSADGLAVIGDTSTALGLLTLMTSCPECVAVADARLFDGAGGGQVLRLLNERRLMRAVVGVVPERPAMWLAALRRHGVQNCVLDTDPIEHLVRTVQSTAAGERGPRQPMEQLCVAADREVAPADSAAWLTERELQVLGLVAGGLSDAAIGRELALSAATITYHVREARQKLGASTRAQAVVLAIRSGWLPLN